MSLIRLMEISEGLMHVDPVRTYPQRGAELVARAVRVERFQVRLKALEEPIRSTPPPETATPLVMPIRCGRERLGEIRLDLGDRKLGEDEVRVVRWAARLYARGLTFAVRLSNESIRRVPEERLDEVLARTALTRRECEVVRLLSEGASTRKIASETGLTISTVNTYMKRIFAKVGVHSRVELIARLAGTATAAAPKAVKAPAEAKSEVLPKPRAVGTATSAKPRRPTPMPDSKRESRVSSAC